MAYNWLKSLSHGESRVHLHPDFNGIEHESGNAVGDAWNGSAGEVNKTINHGYIIFVLES